MNRPYSPICFPHITICIRRHCLLDTNLRPNPMKISQLSVIHIYFFLSFIFNYKFTYLSTLFICFVGISYLAMEYIIIYCIIHNAAFWLFLVLLCTYVETFMILAGMDGCQIDYSYRSIESKRKSK